MNDQRAQILTAHHILFEPGQCVELRILGVDGRRSRTDAGWFDNPEALADAALRYELAERQDGLPNRLCNNAGIYWTINPVNPACLSRAKNRIVEWSQHTTSDRDITCRRWLPIDLDPVRPSGVSSSDEELGAAFERANAVADWFRSELGTDHRLFVMSGNGYHLLYQTDEPNNEESKRTFCDLLRALDERFSDEKVKVDKALFNASRILKVPGTTARKGENTPPRGHRTSYIINDNTTL